MYTCVSTDVYVIIRYKVEVINIWAKNRQHQNVNIMKKHMTE